MFIFSLQWNIKFDNFDVVTLLIMKVLIYSLGIKEKQNDEMFHDGYDSASQHYKCTYINVKNILWQYLSAKTCICVLFLEDLANYSKKWNLCLFLAEVF